jgi:hypothetical protein
MGDRVATNALEGGIQMRAVLLIALCCALLASATFAQSSHGLNLVVLKRQPPGRLANSPWSAEGKLHEFDPNTRRAIRDAIVKC